MGDDSIATPSPVWLALHAKCPRCAQGDLFQPGFLNIAVRPQCPACGLELARNDNGDGPAVFMVFVLGALLVPLALLTDHFFHPPLWLLAIIFGIAILALTLGGLRPIKAYVIALQFKHRPGAWLQE